MIQKIRRQYRRQDWEDSEEQPLLAVDPEPFAIPPGPVTDDQFRAAKIEVMRRRHELRRFLHHPQDAAREPDFVEGLLALSRCIVEEVLARRGLRGAAHGISRVDKNNPARGYRIQAWMSVKKQDGTFHPQHVHIAYTRTIEEAQAKRQAWWQKQYGIDVGENLPEWLAPIVKASAALQSERDERQNEETMPAWEEDDPPEPGVFNHAEEMTRYWHWRNGFESRMAVTSTSFRHCRNCGKPLPR